MLPGQGRRAVGMTSSMSYAPALRRRPLVTQMGLLFGAAITLMLAGVSGLMYAALFSELRAKEAEELKFDLHVQQNFLAAVAVRRNVAHWQREWQENSIAYRRFAWQVIGADGSVRAASANWPVFVRAMRRGGPGAAPVDAPGARATGPQQVLVDTIAVDRLARRGSGNGGVLRGALDISQDMLVLQHYRDKLIALGAAATVLALALAWSLARYGVTPLARLARTVGRAEREHLGALPQSGQWPVELRQLAATFDDMLDALQRSQQQVSLVSSDLAHELRGPIGNVLAASSVTLARSRDVEEYQKTLEVVVEEGKRLSRMLSSILFLVRAEKGEQLVGRQGIAIQAEFDTLADFFDVGFQEQDVLLTATGACALAADPQLLRRALSTLLSEALRHACRGDVVGLACHADDREVVISVDMRGAGWPARQLAFLTERFDLVRLAHGGLDWAGIELAAVRSIVTLHGGTVSVAGAPGSGTRIDLHFPLASGGPVLVPQPQLDEQ